MEQPSGDFSFCMEEIDLDMIMSNRETIIIKYPSSEVFNTKAQGGYITYRDMLSQLEKDKNRLEYYNTHRFIEQIEKTSECQYELHCGS